MNSKSFVIATLVGAVTSFIAGYLVYGVILHEYMMSNSLAGFAKDPDFLWIIVSHILLGAGLTYIWMKWGRYQDLYGWLTGRADIRCDIRFEYWLCLLRDF